MTPTTAATLKSPIRRSRAILALGASLVFAACGSAGAGGAGGPLPTFAAGAGAEVLAADAAPIIVESAGGAAPLPTGEPISLAFAGAAAQAGDVAAGGADAAPMTATVRMVDYAFNPESTTVGVGGAVRFTNAGADRHSVKWDDAPESSRLEPGGTYVRTFEAPGRYPFVCGLHPSMTGSITVTAATVPTPTGAVPTPPPGGAPAPTASPGPTDGPDPTATADPTAEPTADPTAPPTADPTAAPTDDDDGDDDHDNSGPGSQNSGRGSNSGHGGDDDDDDDGDDDDDDDDDHGAHGHG